MLQYASHCAARRRKRTENSPELEGDDSRPDRELESVICEVAWYEWRYGSWREHERIFAAEKVAAGRTDGGEDDVGIDIKGTYLSPDRSIERLNLLVKQDKLIPAVRYVAAFYSPAESQVHFAGYMSGTEIKERFPTPRKVKADGFLNYTVPTTALRDLQRIPHAA